MSKIESRVGVVNASDERIFKFVSNFNNFKNMVPKDTIKDFTSDEDSCKFSVSGVGTIGMKIAEKEPYKLVKITESDSAPIKFFLWIQIKKSGENTSQVDVSVEPLVNPMLAMMINKPLKAFVDTLIDQMEKFNFPE
jgi:carbon monoxide dehydrogenase subunit G